MSRKASLVVNVRVLTRPWRNEEWTLEPGLVGLGDKGPGHVLIVLQTIPGSCGDNAEGIPLALLVTPDGDKLICDGGVCIDETLRCSQQIKSGKVYDATSFVLERWWKANREHWDLTTGANDTMWREVAFLRGYHATPHEERRVELDKRRTLRIEFERAKHERELEAMQ